VREVKVQRSPCHELGGVSPLLEASLQSSTTFIFFKKK
jgi:hypothetical protein